MIEVTIQARHYTHHFLDARSSGSIAIYILQRFVNAASEKKGEKKLALQEFLKENNHSLLT
jgi:hypothetical protein